MKLEGTAEFPFAAGDVWQALHDVEVLTKTIPGCKSINVNEVGEYVVEVALGVAAIKGEYTGTVRVHDGEYPRQYGLYAEGSGKPGYVKVHVDCQFEQNATGTTLRWVSDTEVGGLIAGIGGRVLSGISKFMAKQFFQALNEEMNTRFTALAAHTGKG
jgi:carbon monoxide dehydrogenase subunit G